MGNVFLHSPTKYSSPSPSPSQSKTETKMEIHERTLETHISFRRSVVTCVHVMSLQECLSNEYSMKRCATGVTQKAHSHHVENVKVNDITIGSHVPVLSLLLSFSCFIRSIYTYTSVRCVYVCVCLRVFNALHNTNRLNSCFHLCLS